MNEFDFEDRIIDCALHAALGGEPSDERGSRILKKVFELRDIQPSQVTYAAPCKDAELRHVRKAALPSRLQGRRRAFRLVLASVALLVIAISFTFNGLLISVLARLISAGERSPSDAISAQIEFWSTLFGLAVAVLSLMLSLAAMQEGRSPRSTVPTLQRALAWFRRRRD